VLQCAALGLPLPKNRKTVRSHLKMRAVQCVAVCCNVLQYVAVCCSVLQCVAVCCSVLQCVAVCCSVLQCVAVCFSVLQCVAAGLPLPKTRKSVSSHLKMRHRRSPSDQIVNVLKVSSLQKRLYEMIIELTFEKFYNIFNTMRRFIGAAHLTKVSSTFI